MEKLVSEEEAYLHDVVIAELVWTLEKFYKVPKSKIRNQTFLLERKVPS
jgi:predicted nucleic-acid-binding protein